MPGWEDSRTAKRPLTEAAESAVPKKRQRKGKGTAEEKPKPVVTPKTLPDPLTAEDFDKKGPAERIVCGFETGRNGADPRPAYMDRRLLNGPDLTAQIKAADAAYKGLWEALLGSLPKPENPALKKLASGFASGTRFQDVWRAEHVRMWPRASEAV